MFDINIILLIAVALLVAFLAKEHFTNYPR